MVSFLDARYETVPGGGVIRSRAVLAATGIEWDRRRILAVLPAEKSGVRSVA